MKECLPVKVGRSREYPQLFGRTGRVVQTIGINPDQPKRVMVHLDDGPLVNFLPNDVPLNGLKVKINPGNEYKGINGRFARRAGAIIGAIPPHSYEPHRLLVKLNKGPVVAFKTEEVTFKLKRSVTSP